MRLKKRNIDNQSEVDMTPMLDVVFILLIFFIVTTSFIKETAIEIHRPQQSDAPPPKTKNVLIQLTELNQIVFNDRAILRSAIRSNIEVFLSQNPKAQVLVRVAKTANTGILVNIVDQAKLAGIQQITVGQLAESN
ncbi:MAG: biopolymer transporter ExbD [Enterobacterales bacterium]|nr:biopolymer transporter ExbD [Enterobacterales bacterium]